MAKKDKFTVGFKVVCKLCGTEMEKSQDLYEHLREHELTNFYDLVAVIEQK